MSGVGELFFFCEHVVWFYRGFRWLLYSLVFIITKPISEIPANDYFGYGAYRFGNIKINCFGFSLLLCDPHLETQLHTILF